MKFLQPVAICISLLLAALISHSSLSFASTPYPTSSEAKRDLPEILESGVLRVAMLNTDELPFFYHNEEGEFVGIDVELLALMEQALGVEVEIIREPNTFDSVVDWVAQGRADLGMSYLSITIERAKRVSYTVPYAHNYFAVAVNRVAKSRARTNGDINAFLNRPETRLGVQMGSTYEAFARRNFPKATLVGIADSGENAMAVANGDIDAAVSAKLSLEPLMKKESRLNFLLTTIIYPSEPDLMAAVVHPKNHHLLNWINTFLRQQELLGALDRIKRAHGITIDDNNE